MSPDLQSEIKTSRPFASPETEAYLNLVRTVSVLKTDVARLLKKQGISEAQYNVLRILAGAGTDGLPCAEIGNRMVARVPDITRLIDRLSRAGLVRRQRSADDRRVVTVSITDAGRSLSDSLAPLLIDMHAGHLGHLSDTELQSLNDTLVKIRRRHG